MEATGLESMQTEPTLRSPALQQDGRRELDVDRLMCITVGGCSVIWNIGVIGSELARGLD